MSAGTLYKVKNLLQTGKYTIAAQAAAGKNFERSAKNRKGPAGHFRQGLFRYYFSKRMKVILI